MVIVTQDQEQETKRGENVSIKLISDGHCDEMITGLFTNLMRVSIKLISDGHCDERPEPSLR